MTGPARITFDSLARGAILSSVDLTITHDDVRAYLDATEDTTEDATEDATGEQADRRREHVPPMMLSALMLAALLGQVEIPQGVMHTGQEHESRRAVRIGEPLTVTLTVSSYALRRGALIAAFDAEARAGDEVVATSRASVLVPPAEASAAAGADAANAEGGTA